MSFCSDSYEWNSLQSLILSFSACGVYFNVGEVVVVVVVI